ncbi:hypothetical protein V1502_17710 [Bacillus sp. SCS-153A]
MKKWVIAAVAYLLLVVAGYTVYAQFNETNIDTHESDHAASVQADAQIH